MDVMRRLAATIALVALLACSSAGTCWAQLAGANAGHECCPKSGDTMTVPAKSCASTIAAVGQVDVVPPSASQLMPDPPAATLSAVPISAFAPAFPVVAPPLILRI